jgi:hypothetical protein
MLRPVGAFDTLQPGDALEALPGWCLESLEGGGFSVL